MSRTIRTLTLAASAALLGSAAANAASDATGLWFDHNGRGAVEIAPCASGNGLCGYVVHINDPKNASRCGMQILGNVTDAGGGWIYSPDRGKKYTVELTRLSDDKLRVVGNAGSFFSKTFTWNRAPDTLARCGESTAAAPAAAPAAPAAVSEAPPAKTQGHVEASPDYSTGAASASMALMGAPKKKRVAEVTPVATTTDVPVSATPAVEKAPVQKVAPAPKVVREEESADVAPERTCKYKIPYVGRVISVPCRD